MNRHGNGCFVAFVEICDDDDDEYDTLTHARVCVRYVACFVLKKAIIQYYHYTTKY